MSNLLHLRTHCLFSSKRIHSKVEVLAYFYVYVILKCFNNNDLNKKEKKIISFITKMHKKLNY